MDQILDGSVAVIAAAIREKQIRSVDLVQAFLDRIEKVNPLLNAVICSTGDLAMKYAAKYDDDLAQGKLHGPLHGVPMTIKDSLDTSDAVTTWGTEGRRDFRPGTDATCVARLKSAGAIMLGKTNTPEFTLWFQTDNNLFGPTSNPFDPERTPGGSSGGASAIIAAGGSPFDIGTDTGGSIRLPAHFSGVCGIKPTSGRVPCTGNALPTSGVIARLTQPGPLARQVEDLDFLLQLIEGPDYLDPNCVEVAKHDYRAVEVQQLRIAYHTSNDIKTPDPAIRAAVSSACDLMRADGINVTEAKPSGVEMTNFIMSRVFSADGGELVESLLDICGTTNPSPRIAASIERRGPEISQREFARTVELWDGYRSSMLSFFQDFDVLICPVNAHTAIRHGKEEDLAAYSYTTAYNLTGWPGVVIRAGTDEQGLPVGIQILARPFREDHCLAVASWLEARLGEFPEPAISARKS